MLVHSYLYGITFLNVNSVFSGCHIEKFRPLKYLVKTDVSFKSIINKDFKKSGFVPVLWSI